MARPSNELPVNQRRRVIMKGDHRWAGETGEVVSLDPTPFGTLPRIKLNNGEECYPTHPDQFAVLPHELAALA